MLRFALIVAITVMPTIGYAQDASQSTTRVAQRFSFSFEPDEAVEIELSSSNSEEEARSDEFLRLDIFNGRAPISSIEFNMSRLRLIRITATRTGFGKAELNINGLSAGVVPIRRNRIYLLAQALVSITERDFVTDELILIPADTTLKGLMTFVDLDGTRNTRTIVTSTIKVPVAGTK